MSKDYFSHIEFIKSPKHWPKWPFLPMVKRPKEIGAEPIHGVIFCNYSLTTIKKANLYMLPEKQNDFQKLDGWTFNSVEEMVADGWEVD